MLEHHRNRTKTTQLYNIYMYIYPYCFKENKFLTFSVRIVLAGPSPTLNFVSNNQQPFAYG